MTELRWALKVLVGSRAHGLHTDQSDYDYRVVFIQPTSEILSLQGTVRQTSWVKGRKVEEVGRKQDNTGWEIGHFLRLATHCNPSILEVFAAPIVRATKEGEELRALLPAVWNPKGVHDAFIGYGLNQRKKMLEEKDSRPHKYATAYLRVLCQAEWLLLYGVLLVDFSQHEEYQTLLMFRNNMTSVGAIVDKCRVWQDRVEAAAERCRHEPDLEAVDKFLLRVRQENWKVYEA